MPPLPTVLNRTVLYSKPFSLRLSKELKKAAMLAAAEREMSLNDWIRQAIKAYLRTAKKNTSYNIEREGEKWPSGWPKTSKCFHCKQCGHDPKAEHGYLDDSDFVFAKRHANSCKIE